jgi:3-deoxy-D-manno-octulosonate 8-phosphate phosphatase (KDO 8-P phosphatase)
MPTPFAPNRSWTPELDRKARAISLLLLDVDGVLTDGRLHIGPAGELFKSFHARDGLAVKLAQAAGLEIGILSARRSEIVAVGAGAGGIAVGARGNVDTAAASRELLARRALAPESVAYLGDDLQDLPVLRAAGLAAAPADAAAEVLAVADFVTEAAGGWGAVRELVERVLVARGAWGALVRGFEGESPGDGDR